MATTLSLIAVFMPIAFVAGIPGRFLASFGWTTRTGKVMPGYSREGDVLHFRVRERAGGVSVPVTYSGVVSDTFRGGREIIVKGRLEGGTFKGERDTLTTKCPSKFQKKQPGSDV